MFTLSFFVFILPIITLAMFAFVIYMMRKINVLTVSMSVLTLIITVSCSVLIIDALNGAETVNTRIVITDDMTDKAGIKYDGILLKLTDNDNNSYWGIGKIPAKYSCVNNQIDVEIVYLPRTGFILGLKQIIPQEMVYNFAFYGTPDNCIEIYSNYNGIMWLSLFILILYVAGAIYAYKNKRY